MTENFWQDKKVIVTGGAGFLGSFVIEKLKGRGATDIFIHQCSTDVVTTRTQQLTRTFNADLHPTHLNVVDETVIGDATNGVHQDCFAESWSAS